jgi:hypothetical protein
MTVGVQRSKRNDAVLLLTIVARVRGSPGRVSWKGFPDLDHQFPQSSARDHPLYTLKLPFRRSCTLSTPLNLAEMNID